MSYAGNIKINDTTHLVGSTLYGTCSTSASTAEKEVTLSGFDALVTGVTIQVKFVNTNTAEDPTLKVGTTAAKTIYRYGTEAPGGIPAASWAANSVVTFTYDGTNWMMVDINPMMEDIINVIYPVGSIYMAATNVNPSLLFGGTWVQIKDKFILAAGNTYAVGDEGGAATCTLSTANLPAHTHGSKSMSGNIRLKGINDGYAIGDANNAQEGLVTFSRDGGAALPHIVADGGSELLSDLITINATHEHSSVGSGTAFDILPPYIAVEVWYRTA